eukprot:GFKZ01003506.1.p1 GENE.GFKZ01003506.1~~GFKZ01003506.1.p1  ORF type:complete len:2027 (-),score=174.89 GFKZ01003506.1:214-6294(-)
METRGRGRDAASTEQESHSPSQSLRPSCPGSSKETPQHPATRSRTRLRTAAIRTQASTCPPYRRNPAPSSSPAVKVPSSSSKAPYSSRTKQPSPARQATARASNDPDPFPGPQTSSCQKSPSSSAVSPNAANLPVSRKRTRSSTRKGLPQRTAEERTGTSSSRRRRPGLTSTSPTLHPASSVSPLDDNSRTKRSRASLSKTTPSQDNSAPRQTTGGPLNIFRTSSPSREDMDPRDSNSAPGEQRPGRREVRRDGNEPSALASDRAAPNTLQSLLQRLGADLNEMFPGNVGASHSRLQQLRSTISSPENEGHLLQALSELCEFLSVGTEESLVSFSVNMFVSPIVDILRTGTNIESKILSARALTHMMEALPSSSSSVASHGAAGPLCQNLLSIEYIDLAEQSLYALRKLSVDYPHQIVAANGFQAVLLFIDFFSIGVQRVAAETACNLCRLPRVEVIDMMADVLPIMVRLLDSEDQRIREAIILGFRRLAHCLQRAPSKLELLCGEQGILVRKILGLVIQPSAPALTSESYSSAFHLLALISRGNADLGLQILLSEELILKLKELLGSNVTGLVTDCLALVDSILPDIAELEDTPLPVRSRRRHHNESLSVTAASVDQYRRRELSRDPAPLLTFGRHLFPTLMKFSSSAADILATRSALRVMLKFITMSTKEVLAEVVQGGPREALDENSSRDGIELSSCVAALLRTNRPRCETLAGLAIASSVLQKLPCIRESFIREGVMHEIIRIAECSPRTNASKENSASGCACEEDRMLQSPLRVDRSIVAPDVGLEPAESSEKEESVWTIVAVYQNGNSSRGVRGQLFPSAQRLTTRGLDFRIRESHYPTVLLKVARSILRKHLGVDGNYSIDENVLRNTRLGNLARISKELHDRSDPCSIDEVAGRETLSSLVALLTSPGKLSVFELSKSGIIVSLLHYLNPGAARLRSNRLADLIKALNHDDSNRAFALLVQLSLGVLSFEDYFSSPPVEFSCGDSHVAVSSGLRQLAQPLKLRLRKSSEEKRTTLRDYSHQVVLIEPLATLGSVQDFLWPKVARQERDTEENSAPFPNKHGGVRVRSGRGTSSADGSGTGDQHSSDVDNLGPPRSALHGPDRDREFQSMNESVDDVAEGIGNYFGDQSNDPSDEEMSSGEEEVIGLEPRSSGNLERGHTGFQAEQVAPALPPLELHREDLDQVLSRSLPSSGGSHHAEGSSVGTSSREAVAPTRNFQSYAAALGANASTLTDRVSHREAKSPRLRRGPAANQLRNDSPPSRHATRLKFFMNGRLLPDDCTILSAVTQSSTANERIGYQLWSNVHTLEYCTAETDGRGSASRRLPATQSPRDAVEAYIRDIGRDSSGGLRRSQRLLDQRTQVGASSTRAHMQPRALTGTPSNFVVSDVTLPVPLPLVLADVSLSVVSAIEFLRLLRWLYITSTDRAFRGESEGYPKLYMERGADVHFHSNELGAKLMHQLSNPLVLCGGVVPDWCYSLSRDASFLISFQVRRVFFQSTSLGVARALHLLQDRIGSTGPSSTLQLGSQGSRDQDTRIGRIQRQKVRIHRDRILDSAIKVMNMYAHHSTMLEVQFFDEVGTGLGPTLEFYTMASRELQRQNLNLWRSNSPSYVDSWSSSDLSSASAKLVPHATDECEQVFMSGKRRRKRPSREMSLPRATTASTHEKLSYIVPTGRGLFPSCIPKVASNSLTEVRAKRLAIFTFVGRLIGKAIMDGRLLDLRLSRTMSRLILAYCRVYDERLRMSCSDGDTLVNNSLKPPGKFLTGALDDAYRARVWEVYSSGDSVMRLLEDVDPQLESSLRSIMDMVRDGRSESVSSLCLTFVLPGDDEQELIQDGAEVEVNGDNAEEFVRHVLYHVLFEGVHQQVEALLRGINDILDIRGLLSFDENEIEMLVCGPSFEEWSVEFLVKTTKCDHGFSHDSMAVLNFLRVLSEMTHSEQRQFVLFATGSPALPVGGLGNLQPPLTIVRRTPESGRSPDECLPTVMTCTNYFKLPDYSSREITRKQVLYAIAEGQGAFHLS